VVWYPLSVATNIYTALPELGGCRDRADIERLFKRLSGYIAEDNLSTIYRALLLIMRPNGIFDLLPRLWRTYFRGIEVTTARDGKEPRGTCTVYNLGHRVPYLGVASCGWMEFAWQKVGGRLKVSEENWQRGRDRGDPMIHHFDWS
jgi:hypothetical protein